jgi:CRP-like cAMP-binding protein
MEIGKPAIEVFKYGPGDYFGERALIKNEPRAANIIATTQL